MTDKEIISGGTIKETPVPTEPIQTPEPTLAPIQMQVGYTGSRGIVGYTGSRGVAGFTGSRGNAGTAGGTGPRGATGFTGSRGATGLNGPQGAVGQVGFTGSRGAGYTGSASTAVGPTGPAGSVGFTGSRGTSGPTGVTGPTGPTGVGINTASINIAGNLIITRTDGQLINAGSARGTQGNPGPTGPTGPSGTGRSPLVGGTGSGFRVSVARLSGSDYPAGYDYYDFNVPGSGYLIGDRLRVLGTQLGGSSPIHDFLLEVDRVFEGNGGVQSVGILGGQPAIDASDQNFANVATINDGQLPIGGLGLNSLMDVRVIEPLVENQVIIYGSDPATGEKRWTNGNISGGGSGATYSISAESVSGGANIRLTGSNQSTDDIKLAAGANITITRTDASTITIAAGAGGGGASTLTSLSDVSVSSPAQGQVLSYFSSIGKWVNTVSSGLSSRTTVAFSGGKGSLTVAKTYALLTIKTNAAAWVRIYCSAAAQTDDEARLSTVDPSSSAGVIAEIITASAQTVRFTPAVIGFNDESPVTTTLYVTSRAPGSNTAVPCEITYIKLES